MEANHVGHLESALEVPSKGELRQEEEQVANQQVSLTRPCSEGDRQPMEVDHQALDPRRECHPASTTARGPR